MKRLLVVGASGVIGKAIVEHAAALPEWQLHGLSRRLPEFAVASRVEHLPLDLQDAKACADALTPLRSKLDYVVYAALSEAPGLIAGWSDPELMQRNLRMLEHVLEPLAGSQTLRHVIIMQGTKAYGAHLHPISIPALESAARDAHENFYWLQEDYLRAMCAHHGWWWTILRPQIVLGGAYGVAMNPLPVIAAYAAICREQGIPCAFPGSHVGIWEATDARLIAQACLWAFSEIQARNEIFNITNGDVWVPGHHWPEICAMLGVSAAPASAVRFADYARDKNEIWSRIVLRHDLRPLALDQIFGQSHHYLDLLMCNGLAAAPWPPALVSTIKIRRAGFQGCMDSLDSMRFWFEHLARDRVIPPP